MDFEFFNDFFKSKEEEYFRMCEHRLKFNFSLSKNEKETQQNPSIGIQPFLLVYILFMPTLVLQSQS